MTGHTLSEVWGDGAVGLLLFKTHAGVVWWARFAIALALLISLCVMASLPHVAGEATVVVGLVLAIANFVRAPGSVTPPAMPTIRILASGCPGTHAGSLALAGWARFSRHAGGTRAFARRRDGARASVSFGNIALVAVGLLVVRRIAATALEVRDLSDLTTGAYARLLAVKLVLFCLMLALAAVNRLRLVPRLATPYPGPAATRLWRSILGELVLGMMILVVVGELGIAPLGADE
jgi:putative copper resistance protein D